VSLKTLCDLDPAWISERIEALVRRIEAIDDVFLSPKRNWPQMQLTPPRQAIQV